MSPEGLIAGSTPDTGHSGSQWIDLDPASAMRWPKDGTTSYNVVTPLGQRMASPRQVLSGAIACNAIRCRFAVQELREGF